VAGNVGRIVRRKGVKATAGYSCVEVRNEDEDAVWGEEMRH
jgi:hypothetical protein